VTSFDDQPSITEVFAVYTIFKKHSRLNAALFFLLVFLLGLAGVGGYGHAWDDLQEMDILRMAIREYAEMLPFETGIGQSLEKMGIMRISESIERDHGICLYYPLFWAVSSETLTLPQLSLIWRCYTWMLFTLGLCALYGVARHLGLSRFLSCLGAAIMLLSPRFFAEGHYNNKDIALMVITLVLLWQTARLMEKPTWKRGLGFALAAGICASTRVIGAAFCGLFGLFVVIHLIFTRRLNRKTIAVGVFTILCSVLFYILLTPSFLANPAEFIVYLLKNAVGFSRWHNDLLFFGEIISCAVTKPPRIYLPAFILITTPLWMLSLLAVGCIFAVRNGLSLRLRLLESKEHTLAATCFLSWILPLAACVALRTLVYNGWRHLYVLYGPMVLCMVYGLNLLWKTTVNRRILRRLLAVTVAVCLLFSAVGIVLNHPHQYAYYNILVPAQQRSTIFELDWWNISCVSALDRLMEITDGPVTIIASDRHSRSGLAMASGYVDDPERVILLPQDGSEQPQYILSNLSYACMAGFSPSENMIPVVTIASYGADVTVIYKVLP